jgi:stage V sporulation protein SpoVS
MVRVSSHSDTSAIAGAIANRVRERSDVEIEVIGPRAVKQASRRSKLREDA